MIPLLFSLGKVGFGGSYLLNILHLSLLFLFFDIQITTLELILEGVLLRPMTSFRVNDHANKSHHSLGFNSPAVEQVPGKSMSQAEYVSPQPGLDRQSLPKQCGRAPSPSTTTCTNQPISAK
jgi:hypothetical protein